MSGDAAKILEQLAESAHAELDEAERSVGRRLPHCRALARFMQTGATGIQDELGDAETYSDEGQPNWRTPPNPDLEVTADLVRNASRDAGIAFLQGFERRVRQHDRYTAAQIPEWAALKNGAINCIHCGSDRGYGSGTPMEVSAAFAAFLHEHSCLLAPKKVYP